MIKKWNDIHPQERMLTNNGTLFHQDCVVHIDSDALPTCPACIIYKQSQAHESSSVREFSNNFQGNR